MKKLLSLIFLFATIIVNAQGGGGPVTALNVQYKMKITPVKTANYTLAVNDFVPCNTTSGSFTLMLPFNPPSGSICGAKITSTPQTLIVVQTSSTDVFTCIGGSNSGTITLPGQAMNFIYNSGVWMTYSGDLPLPQLDARYWLDGGNTVGTNTAYIGTNDNRSLNFYSNGIFRGKLDSVGILDFKKTPAIFGEWTNGFQLQLRNGTNYLKFNIDTTVSNPNTQIFTTNGALSLFGPNNANIVIASNDNISLGASNYTPTARCLLIAGNTTYAPIRIPTGALVTNTANVIAGNIEFLTNTFYATTTGTTSSRFKIALELTGSASLDFPNTSAQTSSELTITVTGAVIGKSVSVGEPSSVNANSCFTGRVTSANTVTVKFNNYSSGAIDPASATYNVTVGMN